MMEWNHPQRAYFFVAPVVAILMLALSIPMSIEDQDAERTLFVIALTLQVVLAQSLYARWHLLALPAHNRTTTQPHHHTVSLPHSRTSTRLHYHSATQIGDCCPCCPCCPCRVLFPQLPTALKETILMRLVRQMDVLVRCALGQSWCAL